jgi:hypothetical protein
MGTNSPVDAGRRPYGLVSSVAVALVVGLAVGALAAGTGDVGALPALGVVLGVVLGLGGLAAVPAVMRLVW